MSEKEDRAKEPKQDVLPRIPEGYRRANPEEYKTLREQGLRRLLLESRMETCEAKLQQYKSQTELAQKQAGDLLAQYQALDKEIKKYNKELNVDELPGAIIERQTDIIICVDPEKRIDPTKPPLPFAPKDKQESKEGEDHGQGKSEEAKP